MSRSLMYFFCVVSLACLAASVRAREIYEHEATKPEATFDDGDARHLIQVTQESEDTLQTRHARKLSGWPWGTWKTAKACKPGEYVIGMRTRVEGNQGRGDDTALNAVHFACGTEPLRNGQEPPPRKTILSHPGNWGDWSGWVYCPSGVVTAIKLKIEPTQGSKRDDTAANAISLYCSDGGVVDSPNAGPWGDWQPEWTFCSRQKPKVCGYNVMFEDSQGSGDDTALNDVKITCCA